MTFDTVPAGFAGGAVGDSTGPCHVLVGADGAEELLYGSWGEGTGLIIMGGEGAGLLKWVGLINMGRGGGSY